jgi:hypothetical protein
MTQYVGLDVSVSRKSRVNTRDDQDRIGPARLIAAMEDRRRPWGAATKAAPEEELGR